MSKYILVLRDNGSFPTDISPEEIQAIIEEYGVWMQKVKATGEKLRDGEGRVVTKKDGGIAVTDGPHAEAKEVIGGIFIVEANSYDDVLKLVEDCPHLNFGSIEIREIEIMSENG